MSTNHNVLLNTFAQFTGKIGTVLASFLVVKIISSYGTEFYGNYVTSYEFLAFFGVLADAGLFAIAVRDITKAKNDPQKTEEILGNILTMRLALILLATISAGIIAQFIPTYDHWVKMGIWITGISMALTIIAGTLSAVLQARMKIHYFSGSLVAGKILLALLTTFIALKQTWFELHLPIFYVFLLAGVLSNFLFVSLVYFFARREVKIVPKLNWNYFQKTFTESLPYGVALILQTLYLRADLVIISLILGSSAVGIYGVGARVLESFLVLSVFFGQAMLPRLSEEEKNQKKFNETFSWGIEKSFIFAVPIIWGVVIFAEDLVKLLSSEEYLSFAGNVGADHIIKILVFTVLFAFFNQLLTLALVTKKKQKYLLGVNLFAFLANVGLNFYFLPIHGIQAAAWTTILCEIFVFLGLLFVSQKFFEPKVSSLNFLFIFGLNAALFCLVFFSPLKENLITSAIVCAGIYGGFFVKFRRRFF